PVLDNFAAGNMHGAVHTYGKGAAVFVMGNSADVLGSVSSIWDHGHERKFTTADQTYYSNYIDDQLKHGVQVHALAYRVLPKQLKGKHLQPAEDYTNDLILLGFIAIASPLHEHAATALEQPKSNNLAISWTTNMEPALAAGLLRQVKQE